MQEIKITKKEENQRLDKFLLKMMNKASKGFVYKMLRKKRIKLNGKRAEGNEMLAAGDMLQLYLAEDTVTGLRETRELTPVEKQFTVCYEDEDILVVNKPAGLLVHPETDEDRNTLIDQILYDLYQRGEYAPENPTAFPPALCNRLDRNTSGLVLVGKTLRGTQQATAAIREKRIDKVYYTIVKGKVKSAGEISAYLSKDMNKNQVRISMEATDGKHTLTKYRPLLQTEECTLLEIQLITGKTHQIRGHMQFLGHPVIGDKKYGDAGINRRMQQAYGLSHHLLHAGRLVWVEETGGLSYLTGKMFKAPVPQEFRQICTGIFGARSPVLD